MAQPAVRELVLAALSGTEERLLREGGTPRHELSGTSGPLRPEVTLRRREILVTQYTPAAWRSQVAWHAYWDEHGGFGGANLENEQLMAGSPPTPRREHRKVRVTWGKARKWVREEAAACKASSDTSRAAASGPGRRVGLQRGHDTTSTALPSSCETGSHTGPRAAARSTRSGRGPTRRRRRARPRSARPLATPLALLSASTRLSDARAPRSRPRAACSAATRRPPSPRPPTARAAVWWPAAQGTAPRGEVLLKALPAGRLACPAEVQASITPFPAAPDLRVVRRPDAGRSATRRTLLRQTLPAGSSRFGLAVKRTAPTTARTRGPSDASRPSPTPAETPRRGRAQREVLDDVSRSMRFAYADPPYPGRAHYYPEQTEVDYRAMVERLVAEFEDGWALSTSAEALQDVLAVCPPGCVCARGIVRSGPPGHGGRSARGSR